MNKSHKLLFNFAVYFLSFPKTGTELDMHYLNGSRITRRDGVIVVPEVAHLLTGFLSAVAVCLSGLLLLSYKRRINLHTDPDTLATKMSLVAQSQQLLQDFEGADNCPDIGKCIKRRQYKLRSWDEEDGYGLEIADAEGAETPEGSHESSTKPHDGRGIRPWELSVGMGVGIAIFSAGLLVFLIALYGSSQKHSGRRPPTHTNLSHMR